jgi:outer membrane lipoprotein SlyB
MNRYFRSTLVIALWAMFGVSPVMAAVNVKVPAGTSLQVRIDEKLSSEKATVGQVFHGSLAAAVIANGKTLFPKGAIVTGEVVNVQRSGRLSTPGELDLSLRTIRTGGRTYPVSAQTVVIKGESHTKSNVTKIGGGSALGALIGAVAGGGKGAAIGAGVGAAAGTGVAAGSGKKPAEVESETVLAWIAQGAQPVVSTQRQDSGQYSGEPETEAEEHHENRRYSRDDGRDEDYDGRGPMGFSDRDRQIIGDCFVNDRAGLPPGLAKKDRLPPGLEQQLRRNGTLPPGLQKRAQRLPGSCEARLPRLPNDWVRVAVSGRIIMLDSRERIVDLFWLDRD